ncbi:hypothetical protein CTA2_4206 [Colletotrichum tanaceti]|uniref:MYND-type domain-containing protein n=1 Tax=Colletotrichum tanaceti TaxID=1306861 RepID=A0A4V6DG67_9PEZI|nr:hypothetical protein CTA2_4206 [Colletotrichum tanaceti]TKW51726.1 hypothetical protein CTA1_9006 [Colletotrichum tanaceti]
MTGIMGGGQAPAAILGDTSRCHGCRLSSDKFSVPLKKCSACGKAWYHSQDCQRKHWKEHKPDCLANRPGRVSDSPFPDPLSRFAANGAYEYYNDVARKSPEARSLLLSLRLDPASSEGTAKPLKRLVLTGQDSPENIRLLFGPNAPKSMAEDHAEARIEALLDPPPGSPAYVMSAYNNDTDIPRSPRPATEAEHKKLRDIREMQEAIGNKIGAGKSPQRDDMKTILSSFGPNWPTKLPLYTLALNTMDQGVNPEGNRA